MRQDSLLAAIVLAIAFWTSPIGPSALGQVQLCAPEKLEALRAALPATEDEAWQEFFRDPATVFYTEDEMPAAYQFMGGFHLARHNLSGEPSEPFGNANREFPWRVPGGTDDAEAQVLKFTFFRLPQRDDGRRWPIVYWRENWQDRNLASPLLVWSYPVETTFGECLLLKDSQGYSHAFEVRLRTRSRTGWGVEILRPYPTVDALLEQLASIDTDEARRVAAELRAVNEVKLEILRDPRQRAFETFNVQAPVETLPAMSETLAAKLLAVPFREAAGASWRETISRESDVVSPTSTQAFGIVPKGYGGAFLGNDSKGCMRCHQHTLLLASEIQPFRDWYGHVRGSADGIFSFHPIDPRSISNNGAPWPIRLRPELAELLERYDPRQHPSDRYTFIELRKP